MTTEPAAKGRSTAAFVAAAAVVAVALVAAALVFANARAAREAVVRGDAAVREAEVARVAAALERELGSAEGAVADFEKAELAGAVDDRDEASLRRYLLAEAIARPALVELALVAGERASYQADGAIVLEREGRRESAVARDAQSVLRPRPSEPFVPDGPGDPTLRGDFRAAANLSSQGKPLATDLRWTEIDAPAAGSWRRKVVTVEKAIFGRGERFVGVLRASATSATLEQLGDAATREGRTTFVGDAAGRLATRLDGRDEYVSVDAAGKPSPTGDLRVISGGRLPGVDAALAWAAAGGRGSTRLDAGWLVTLRPLTGPRPWFVGSVVAERVVMAPIEATRDRTLAVLAVVALGLAAATLAASARALRTRR